MAIPSEAELVWLAAIVDGEGSICCARPSHCSARPRIAVYNSNWLIVKRTKEILHSITERKVSAVRRDYRGADARGVRSNFVSWQVQVQRQSSVRKVIQAILPHLVGKAEQARLALQLSSERDRTKSSELADRISYLNRNPPQPDSEPRETGRHRAQPQEAAV